MRMTISTLALLTIVACAPTAPDSGWQGVGFNDYSEYQRDRRAREAELTGSTLPPPERVSSEPLSAMGTQNDAESVAADARAALDRTRDNADEAAFDENEQQSANLALESGFSIENDFEAVDARRSIEDDAALMARNREQYKLIEPTALPSRDGAETPNIVAFALSTDHAPGTQVFRRSGLNSEARHQRNCAQYASADLAQVDFLARGGPERDRLGLDPEGDGFACGWDPRPFRAAVAAGGGA